MVNNSSAIEESLWSGVVSQSEVASHRITDGIRNPLRRWGRGWGCSTKRASENLPSGRVGGEPNRGGRGDSAASIGREGTGGEQPRRPLLLHKRRRQGRWPQTYPSLRRRPRNPIRWLGDPMRKAHDVKAFYIRGFTIDKINGFQRRGSG